MSEWISVHLQKPKPGQCVLVYRPDALNTHDPLIRIATYQGDNGTRHHGFDCYCTPSHWQPLPEPPQA
ncbi:DUF551 domain-containing protein [Pseudomonas sp. HPB0071]|uniref:DUF551 domain-containing protein n=1 Tax=unclassified Pseudomonas TaxID=196821 RepID=UPI00055FE297